MFKDVSHMNNIFGNPKGDPNQTNWIILKNQCHNILDEYRELQNALEDQDIKEVRDALCDILVFTLGAYHLIGYDANKDMQEVYRSNMSKLCKTQEEIKNTLKHYQSLGIEVYTAGETPYAFVKSAKTQTDHNGKNYPANKFLKNVNWQEPNFDN